MRVSLYEKPPLMENVDGGTQTSPAVETMAALADDDMMEAGCQVTPGLETTVRNTKNMTGAAAVAGEFLGDTEKPGLDTPDVSLNMKSSSAQVSSAAHFSLSTDKSQSLVTGSQIKDIVDSLHEEMMIDLPEENTETTADDNPLDITESGRKNPSPVTERRGEVDTDDDNVDHSVSRSHVDREESIIVEKEAGEEDHEDILYVDKSLEYLNLPSSSQVKNVPSSQERKELRQATLSRYLGAASSSTLSPLITPASSPPPQHVEPEKEKPRPRKIKAKETTIFPAKHIKFEYQRFSRYKLKADTEKMLVETSEDFMQQCLQRMSKFADERGADKIHLCDIKRMMVECGFVKREEDDPKKREFYCEIREIARESLAQELIPCDKGAGVVYPPKDCWELKGGRRRTQSKSSSSLGSNKKKKADTMRRFKVRI